MTENKRFTQLQGNRNPGTSASFLEESVSLESTSLSELYEAFHKTSENPVLLETGVPGGNSLLVWNPVAVISIEGGVVKSYTREGFNVPPSPSRSDLVPSYIQRIVDDYRVKDLDSSAGEHPFIGGFVGFVGYEWMVQQELSPQKTEKGVPDMWFGLYDRAVVVTESHLVKIVAATKINGISLGTVRNQFKEALSRAVGVVNKPASSARMSFDFPKEEYERGVRDVKKAIRSGDVYQVDIAQRIRASSVEPCLLYDRLTKLNPSPFSGILSADSFTIVSASPECLLRVWLTRDGKRLVSTRPIAGTRPRAAGAQDARLERSLRRSPKEIAEHTMLVDLSRNDIGRVAVPGTVEVSELYTVERYSHVMHLVSEARGVISENTGIPELFRALFPGGSITGTPKIRSTEIIAEVEPVPRGAYTGSMGYISLDGTMNFNILIRSAFFPGNGQEVHLYAGAGIVQDSNPLREWEETRAKAAALIEAINGKKVGGFPWSAPHVTSSWKREAVVPRFKGSRVLMIDNYDSFTYNLVQYLTMLGAEVKVVRNNKTTISELKRIEPTHVVISPGPGIPKEAGITLEAVHAFSGYPMLGVCLGHQAIVEAYGGTLRRARLPMHGKISRIVQTGDPENDSIFRGIQGDFPVGRYHSLIADEVPSDLLITAKTESGEIMGVRHRDLPTYGVQFHPESILTPQGMQILSNFMEVKSAEVKM